MLDVLFIQRSVRCLLAAALLLTGCAAPLAETTPTTHPGSAIPIATAIPAATAIPSVTAIPSATAIPAATAIPSATPTTDDSDLEAFKAALLNALMTENTTALQGWMSAEVLTAGWRADGAYTSQADAMHTLYTYEHSAGQSLTWVQNADLRTLLGNRDPLSFVRADAGVFEAALVSGWGKDGRDEAILFLARGPDNVLKWHGWMRINGGFSGARLGGIQPYRDAANGFRFFLPAGIEVQQSEANTTLFLAPGEGHPGESRAAAFLEIQPANGRTVEAITEQVKADLGPEFDIPPGTALGLDKATAIVLSGLPGQDANRQLFVVYHDRLIHLTFVPDTPQAGDAYTQMDDLYAMIVNTFTFTE